MKAKSVRYDYPSRPRGTVIATLLDKHGHALATGVAKYNPHDRDLGMRQDVSMGERIARGRAMAAFDGRRPTYTAIVPV